MKRSSVALILLVAMALSSCGGDEVLSDPTATTVPQSTAAASPEVTPSVPAPTATAEAPATPAPQEGIFLESRWRVADRSVTLPPRPRAPFQEWDRESVVIYDIEQGTETNLGPGYSAGFSTDGAKLAYGSGAGPPYTELRVRDMATGEEQSSPMVGMPVAFGNERLLILAGQNASILDVETGERMEIFDIDDPELHFKLDQRLRPSGAIALGDGLVLTQAPYWEMDPVLCPDRSEQEVERCEALLFEERTVRDLVTGAPVLELTAVHAAAAGSGEIVIATSPQCKREDGSIAWCGDVLAEVRPTLDRAGGQPHYLEGTTNLFLVDALTGAARFIATATYNPNAFIRPTMTGLSPPTRITSSGRSPTAATPRGGPASTTGTAKRSSSSTSPSG